VDSLLRNSRGEDWVFNAAGYSRDCRSVSQSLARVTAKNPESVPTADKKGKPAASEIFSEYLAVGTDDGNRHIYGRVIDYESGEPVVMGVVRLAGSGAVTITDSEGFFRIKNKSLAGKISIAVDHVAYKSVSAVREVTGDPVIIPVRKRLHETPVVKVVGSMEKKRQHRTNFEQIDLRTEGFTRSAFSQVDPVYSLKESPVISSSSDFDGRFSIHGSSPDANAFFLDGLLFPSPYHLGGLCSIYDPANIKSFSFSRAPYSASSFGGTGAVVEVRTKDGLQPEDGNTFSLGVLSSSISSRGLISDIYGSLLARRSYIDLIYNSVGEEGNMKIPNFYDLQGSLVRPMGGDYYLKLGLILSGDNSEMKADRFVSGSDGVPVLNWHRGMNAFYAVLAGRGGSREWVPRATLGWQPYSFRFDISGSDDERMHWSGGRGTFRLDAERGYSGGKLRTGVYASVSGIDYDLHFGRGFWLASRNENSAVRAESDGWEFINRGYKRWNYSAGYGEFTWGGSTAAVRAGLRLEHFSGSDLFISPSLSVMSDLSEGSTLRLSGGIFARDTRNDFGNPASVSDRAGVEKAAECSASLNQAVSENLTLQLNGFLRRDWDLLVETEPVHFEHTGRGRGYGFDIGVEKDGGGWTGIVKYAYTKSVRRDGPYTLSFRPDNREGNEGSLENILVPSYWYQSPYERRHSILIEGSKRVSDNLRVIMKWSYNSGKPYTPVGEVEEVAPGYYVASEGRKMSAVLPPYSRLDLRVEWSHGRSVIFGEVMNLTNNSNYFNFQYNENYTSKNYYKMLSLVPAFGVNIHF